ncbi:hypothetical protein VTH06DRAFT_8284 [Thermothelomyces fergusii]
MPAVGSDDGAVFPEQQPLLARTATNEPTAGSPTGGPGAFGIVISVVIGSGVFTSPGSIDTNVPSPGVALLVWLVGGVLAWTGASTMAELGTAIPGEGGVQPYLKHIFGDVFGFLAAWTWVVAVMPATLAILSIVFIESIYSAVGVTGEGDRIGHKLLSIVVLACIGAANSISTKASTRLNNFFVVTKFVTIAAIVLAGIVVVILQLAKPESQVGGGDWDEKPWFGYRDSVNPDGSVMHWDDLSQWDLFGHLSAALYAALWAYSGWDKAIYVSAELSAPARQLPLAINTSLPSIILCFLTANAAYYILLPWRAVSTTDSVAVTAITRLLGSGFGIVAAGLICLVVAGSLLGNSFVAGRMAVAAANQNWLPRLLSVVGRVGAERKIPDEEVQKAPESDAPINAIILSTVLGAVYILLGSFRALLTFNGLGEYTFFFLTVLGAILLRYRQPELERPYKPFIVTPLVFAICHARLAARESKGPDDDEEEPDYSWLVSAAAFARARAGLPDVLVLASQGPVFSSGHDLRELRTQLAPAEVAETFRLCAEVMTLVRRSPAPVVGRVAGHAVAAGCQLALAADLPVAHAAVRFRLPGAALGLPCSSPVAAVSRRIGNAAALRMLLTAEDVPARELGGAVKVVGDDHRGDDGSSGGGGGGGGQGPDHAGSRLVQALDAEVGRTVTRLLGMSPQQNAMGKWAFWTQASLTGGDYVGPEEVTVQGSGGDGFQDAVEWAGRVMALHAKSEDAKEGMDAFLEKRQPVWYGSEQ